MGRRGRWAELRTCLCVGGELPRNGVLEIGGLDLVRSGETRFY